MTIRHFTEHLLRHRALAVLLVLAALVVICQRLPQLRFDNSLDAFFLKDDPVLASYDRFKKLFGSDEYVLIVAKAPPVWTADFMEKLRGLTSTVRTLDDVLEVTSVTNVRYIHGQENELLVEDLVPESMTDPGELAQRRAVAMAHPYYRDFFVTRDGSHVSILARTAVHGGSVEYKIALTRRLRALIAAPEYAGWEMRAVGAPILDADVETIVTRESAVFGGIVFAMVALGLGFVFRSVAGVLVPMVISLLAIAATFGVMTLRNSPVGILSPIIPSFMISVGIGSAIYLVNEIYQHLHAGYPLRQAIVEAMHSSGTSAILSVVTTAGGLLAFSYSRIRAVQDIGIAMGLGLLICLGISLLVVPIAFSRLRSVRPSARRAAILRGRVKVMEHLVDAAVSHRKKIAVVSLLIAVIAGLGASRLRGDYYYLGNFKSSTAIRQDYEMVDRVLQGSNAIEVLVDTGVTDGVKQPAVLEMMAGLQRDVEARHRDLGLKSYSVVDVIREVNQALGGGDPGEYKLPVSQNGVAEELFLFSMSGNNEISKLATPDFRTARITLTLRNVPNSRNEAVFADIDAYMRNVQIPAGIPRPTVEVTGLVKMWSAIHLYLRESQISSLWISATIVAGVLALVMRSLRLALLLFGLNAFAVLITLGVMGWADIPLDPFTLLIASIALGLLDDDTIHLMVHVRHKMSAGMTLTESIRDAFASIGQAMFYLAGVMILAFAVYAFSQIAGLTKFGLLTALTILAGSGVELMVTPAVLVLTERFIFPRRGPVVGPSADAAASPSEPGERVVEP